jgi:hypothetical protein
MKPSKKALATWLETESEYDSEDTDCPEGCRAEPDGNCPHGYASAASTLEIF